MIKFTTMDDDGNETEHELPSKMAVCDRCEGHGTHLAPSIGGHAYSMEEFEESFSTDEEKDEYFKRGGCYDVRCEECKGLRVTQVLDVEACTGKYEELLKRYQDLQEDERQYHMECAAERRAGC